MFDPTVFPKLPAGKVINFQLDGSHHMDCMRAMVLDYEGDGLSLNIGGYSVGTEAHDSSFTTGSWELG